MKITINNEGKRIRLLFPTGLIMNPVGFFIFKKLVKINGVDFSEISEKSILKISKVIRQCKRDIPSWKLVDIESNDGISVMIEL